MAANLAISKALSEPNSIPAQASTGFFTADKALSESVFQHELSDV
jgi:hypothetical protein